MAQNPDTTDDMMQCPICLEQFDVPRALPCLHTFCEKCLIDWVKHKSVTSTLTIGSRRSFPCPVCKDDASVPPEGVKGFRHNFYIASLSNPGSPHAKASVKGNTVTKTDQLDSSRDCHRCEENGVAKVCLKCNVWLCPLCCEDHQRVRATKAHILIPGSDLMEGNLPENITSEDLSSCEAAEHEKSNGLFCLLCKALICEDCEKSSHVGHETVHIICKLDNLRDSLLDSLGVLQKRDELLKKQYSVIVHSRKDLVSRGHKVIQSFDKGVEDIQKKIQSLKSKRHKELKKQIAGQLKLLDERMMGLNDKILLGESVQEEIKFVLESGSNKDILTQSNTLTDQAQRWVTGQASQLENIVTVTMPTWKPCEEDIFDQLLTKLLGSISSSAVEININKPMKSKRSKRKQSDCHGNASRQNSNQSEASGAANDLAEIIRDFDPLQEENPCTEQQQFGEPLVDISVPTITVQDNPIPSVSVISLVQDSPQESTESPASDAESENTVESCPDYVNVDLPVPPTGPFYGEAPEDGTDEGHHAWWAPPHGPGGFRHPPPPPPPPPGHPGVGPPGPPHWNAWHRFPRPMGHPPRPFGHHHGHRGHHGKHKHGKRMHPHHP